MIRPILIVIPLVCSIPGVSAQEPQTAANEKQVVRPALPPYQMRKQVLDENRLSPTSNGSQLFSNRCGACHLDGGMGTNLLTAQRVKLGELPEMGLLEKRNDLTVDYVKAIVRYGKMTMPRLSQVDVTNAELEKIARYLAKEGTK